VIKNTRTYRVYCDTNRDDVEPQNLINPEGGHVLMCIPPAVPTPGLL
jgi:hypothetical protein